MERRTLEINDIIQISPSHANFPCMLLVVTSPNHYGCQGYLLSETYFEATRYKGKAYVRIAWDEMEYVGKLRWDQTEIQNES
jgi:hypothetical protein